MPDSIKTITDKSEFDGIFKDYFAGKNIFIKTKSGNIKIQYLGYSEDRVAFRIPHVKNTPEVITAFTRQEMNTIYIAMKSAEHSEDTFVFEPLKFQIITETRKEDRKLFNIGGGGKDIFYIGNVISDLVINSALEKNDKKVEQIRESVRYDLENRFEKIKILFMHEGRGDVRMKQFLEKYEPIFIPDLSKDPEPKYEKAFRAYVSDIYSKDHKLSGQKQYISEATAPILFGNLIPYGYVQVNNTTPMTEGYLAMAKRSAIVINEFFRNENMFVPYDDRVLVCDISKSGIGVVFRERRTTRLFRTDSLVSFDMMLPTKKKSIVGAMVRNVNFLENGVIKVGLEIKSIDAISQVNYEEFLELAGKL